MRPIHITVVVAPNGLGHLRRTCGVLDLLSRRLSSCSVTLVCQAWQAEALSGTSSARRVLDAASIVTGVTEPGVSWSTAMGSYGDGRLLAWELRLLASGALHDADLVLSDNLVGVLDVRPDAILLGSFLWSDVLDDSEGAAADVARFVSHERDLLERHRPPMLCVGDMAMPGVVDRATAIPLGWMCDEDIVAADGGHDDGVAVLGGGSGALDAELAAAVTSLVASGRRVAASASVLSFVEPDVRGAATVFTHTPAAYRCAVVVCRPGMGTMTDCVAAGVPMVLFHDSTNAEMAHNARRAAALGIGVDVEASSGLLVGAVQQLVGAAGEAARARIGQLPKDGLAEAALWLESLLTGRGLIRPDLSEAGAI